MQRAIVVERKGSSELNQYLAKGWIIEKMTPFHPDVSVSSGGYL